jgi:hypothetical protein
MKAVSHVSFLSLWPTRVGAFQYDDIQFDLSLKTLIMNEFEKRFSGPGSSPDRNAELRVFDLFSLQGDCIKILRERVLNSVKTYLGPESLRVIEDFDLDARAVILPDRGFIQTHLERHESDLAVAYFLTGNAVGKPLSYPGNPRFVIEDPSRSLNDLRLPFEDRHSVHLAPRPGLLLVYPAHLPHHVQPYQGIEPHIQIVCNLKIHFVDGYSQRW